MDSFKERAKAWSKANNGQQLVFFDNEPSRLYLNYDVDPRKYTVNGRQLTEVILEWENSMKERKVEVSLPIPPEGYEYTGEYRRIEKGEFYLDKGVLINDKSFYGGNVHVLRKIVKTVPMTAFDLAMLPQGTAFVAKDGKNVFNPHFVESSLKVYIYGMLLTMYYSGYILPNTTVILPFTKEE